MSQDVETGKLSAIYPAIFQSGFDFLAISGFESISASISATGFKGIIKSWLVFSLSMTIRNALN